MMRAATSCYNLVCVYHRGRFVLAHWCHQFYDFSDDQGMEILKFLREPGNIKRLREGLQHVATLTEEGRWQLWHYLYPNDTCILEVIARATAEKHVPIWLDVATWCERAYVVDLDQNTFEVFKGSETKQEAPTTRFNDVGGDHDTVPALLKSFSFSQLPATEKEFMRALKAAIKEKGNRLFL
jgi:hypothetical protein